MFESITIKSKDGPNSKFDVGFFAECLLFYGTVNLLLINSTFEELVRGCGLLELERLVNTGRLNLIVRQDSLGPAMPGDGSFALQAWSKKDFAIDKFFFDGLSKFLDKGDELDAKIKFFSSNSSVFKYGEGLIKEIYQDLQDQAFMSKAVPTIIRSQYPELVLPEQGIVSNFNPTGKEWFLDTYTLDFNVDMDQFPNITASSIVLNIAEAKGNLEIAGTFNSEIADKVLYTDLAVNKIDSLVGKFEKSQSEISTFQEVVLKNYRPIGDSIRDGSISFQDLMPIIIEAEKFRDWLSGQGEEYHLIEAYYTKISENTFLQKLVPKTVRWSFFNGAIIAAGILLPGLPGIIAGLAISAGDTFLLEKISKGWRPNQFIDSSIKAILPKQ